MLICNISHKIGDKSIFNNINLTLKESENLLVLGQSGCGKTTLFSILTGLQKPSDGDVVFDDVNLNNLSQKKLDNFRGNNVGIIFQQFHLIPVLSVKENIEIGLSFNAEKKDKIYFETLLKKLDLTDKQNQKTESLSIGEQQRVAIARALINKPKWVFADEPTSALDDVNAKNTIDILKKYAQEYEASLIVATHDKRVKDEFLNDNILQLDGVAE